MIVWCVYIFTWVGLDSTIVRFKVDRRISKFDGNSSQRSLLNLEAPERGGGGERCEEGDLRSSIATKDTGSSSVFKYVKT